jgi:hypothetical protein
MKIHNSLSKSSHLVKFSDIVGQSIHNPFYLLLNYTKIIINFDIYIYITNKENYENHKDAPNSP